MRTLNENLNEYIATGPEVAAIRERLNVLNPVHTDQEKKHYRRLQILALVVEDALESEPVRTFKLAVKVGVALKSAQRYIEKYSYVLPPS